MHVQIKAVCNNNKIIKYLIKIKLKHTHKEMQKKKEKSPLQIDTYDIIK